MARAEAEVLGEISGEAVELCEAWGEEEGCAEFEVLGVSPGDVLSRGDGELLKEGRALGDSRDEPLALALALEEGVGGSSTRARDRGLALPACRPRVCVGRASGVAASRRSRQQRLLRIIGSGRRGGNGRATRIQ